MLITFIDQLVPDGEQAEDAPQFHFSHLPMLQLAKLEYSWGMRFGTFDVQVEYHMS
jgi:hypothetical protein